MKNNLIAFLTVLLLFGTLISITGCDNADDESKTSDFSDVSTENSVDPLSIEAFDLALVEAEQLYRSNDKKVQDLGIVVNEKIAAEDWGNVTLSEYKAYMDDMFFLVQNIFFSSINSDRIGKYTDYFETGHMGFPYYNEFLVYVFVSDANGEFTTADEWLSAWSESGKRLEYLADDYSERITCFAFSSGFVSLEKNGVKTRLFPTTEMEAIEEQIKTSSAHTSQ